MYEMLMVQPPFTQEGQSYEFTTFKLPIHLSNDCKDLLSKLLEIDPQKRLSARQTLEHPFLESQRKSLQIYERKRFKELKIDF
jgi:serine/threonine protein kinase